MLYHLLRAAGNSVEEGKFKDRRDVAVHLTSSPAPPCGELHGGSSVFTAQKVGSRTYLGPNLSLEVGEVDLRLGTLAPLATVRDSFRQQRCLARSRKQSKLFFSRSPNP